MMLANSTSHCFLAGNKLRLCLGSEALIFALTLRQISKTYHLVTSHKRIYRPEILCSDMFPRAQFRESSLFKLEADLSTSKRIHGHAWRHLASGARDNRLKLIFEVSLAEGRKSFVHPWPLRLLPRLGCLFIEKWGDSGCSSGRAIHPKKA